jgi:basic amino acid/polyamine antiporter, APA family
VFSGVAVLTILPGELDFLATMYSFGAMLSFTVAHVAVLRLRSRRAGRERSWKPPANFRFRGVELPLTAVLGGIGTFGAWIVVMVLNVSTLIAGTAWMLIGLAAYMLYRRHQGLPLTKTVKVQHLAPLGVEEVEYRSVLIALEDEPFSEETVGTALALAAKRRRAIHVLSLIEVPTNVSLDAPMPAEEERARSRIEQAKLICGLRVSGQIERVRPGQAATAIIERAKEIKAAAIVMQLRYRNGKPLYGRTLQTVLAQRPTRVIVAARPEEARGRSPVAAAVPA